MDQQPRYQLVFYVASMQNGLRKGKPVSTLPCGSKTFWSGRSVANWVNNNHPEKLDTSFNGAYRVEFCKLGSARNTDGLKFWIIPVHKFRLKSKR